MHQSLKEFGDSHNVRHCQRLEGGDLEIQWFSNLLHLEIPRGAFKKNTSAWTPRDSDSFGGSSVLLKAR